MIVCKLCAFRTHKRMSSTRVYCLDPIATFKCDEILNCGFAEWNNRRCHEFNHCAKVY